MYRSFLRIVWFQKISIASHGREWKFREVGGVIGPGISGGGGGGEGCCFDEFFSRPVSNFLLLYIMFCHLHECKKLNLTNLKQKMNIFGLVRLDILSPQESVISRVVASDRSACCGK